MERITISPRQNWKEKVEQLDFYFHTMDNKIYWDESACYQFTQAQIDELDDVTNELHGMCLQAVEHVITNKLYGRLAIPEWFQPVIEASWERKETPLYGRFDFAYNGTSPPKMLEYNADTPTALLEASVVQWFWLKDTFPNADQFNSIHEKLVARWEKVKQKQPDIFINFTCVDDHLEDLGTVEYIKYCASEAGIEGHLFHIQKLGWVEEFKQFINDEGFHIQALFKLYPWEWLVQEAYGKHFIHETMTMFEPAWKMILSNKGILPILWEMFPNHPNLLASYDTSEPLNGSYVKKPLLSREGANISIHTQDIIEAAPGDYGKEGFIYQEYVEMPNYHGNYPVIGSWVIGHKAAGIGIREDDSRITKNTSRFVPHFFE